MHDQKEAGQRPPACSSIPGSTLQIYRVEGASMVAEHSDQAAGLWKAHLIPCCLDCDRVSGSDIICAAHTDLAKQVTAAASGHEKYTHTPGQVPARTGTRALMTSSGHIFCC